MGCASSCTWMWDHHRLWSHQESGSNYSSWQGISGLVPTGHAHFTVRCMGAPPPSPSTTSCWALVPPPELWGQGDGCPACICDGGWGLSRSVCMILRAMGFQDQILPSASRCLTTQSHIHCPHLTPGGASSHLGVSLGLHLTPAEPCFLLCQGQHRCPLQAGFRDPGRGISQCGKGREGGPGVPLCYQTGTLGVSPWLRGYRRKPQNTESLWRQLMESTHPAPS